MAITYASGPGTIITSYAMNESLGSQTQQTGNNQVIVSDLLSVIGNGQIGNGTNGVGDTYLGRIVVINRAGTIQRRRVTNDAAGTGTTRILTVHNDWDTNPVSSDTIHVCYELGDIEDGGAGGGINLNTKTGLWELSRELTVGNGTDPAGLQVVDGQALECDDQATSPSLFIFNNGDLYFGYESGGLPINGGILTSYNNTNGEPWVQCQSGSLVLFYDSFLWAQLVSQQIECASGSDVTFWNSKILFGTDELLLYGAILNNITVVGKGLTTEIVRVNSLSVVNQMILLAVDTLDTVADTTTETIELKSVTFVDVTDYINVRNNKTWNMIDPIWDAITYTDFVWVGSTSNEINDRKSVTAIVQEPDGTKLQNALVIIYENTQLDDLVLELVTDSDGFAEDSFIYKKHATNSVTTTYGGHALRIFKWLYEPFVATQVSTESFDGTVSLIDDINISETTQATAKSNGSGITWNEDTNPSELFEFSGGSGAVADGMILTFSPSGAVGTVTGLQSGDSTAGEIHLKDRNATAIANGDTFSRTGGTAGTFSGTYTNDSKQPFTIWIDGNSLSMQIEYDYFMAILTETTLTATAELIHEWGRDSQGKPLYKIGSNYSTERSNGKGIFITKFGTGSISYFTDDAGNTWVPPVDTSVSVTQKVTTTLGADIQNARVIIETADGTGPFPYEESVTIVRSGSTATVTHTGHGLETNDKVAIRNADQHEYNGVKTITVTGANSYTYTVSGTPDTPATGTIISSFVAIQALTDVNGEVTMVRVFPSDQPIKGFARKSTSSPFYKDGIINGTVDSVDGFSGSVALVLDE